MYVICNRIKKQIYSQYKLNAQIKYTIQQLQMRTQEYIGSHTNSQWHNNINYPYQDRATNDAYPQQRYGSIKKNKNIGTNNYNHHISINNRMEEQVLGYGNNFGIDQLNKQISVPKNKQIQTHKYEQFQLINRPNANTQHDLNQKPKQMGTTNKLKITIQKLNSQQPHPSMQKQPNIDSFHHLVSENSQYSPSPQKKYSNISPQIRNSINNMQTNHKATNYNHHNNEHRNMKKQQNTVKQEVQINKYFNNQSDIQQSDEAPEQIQLKQLKLLQKNSPSKPTNNIKEMVAKKQISKVDQQHRELIINQSSTFRQQEELVSKQFKKSQNFRITQFDSNKKLNHQTNSNQYTNISKYNKFSIKSIDNGAHRPEGLTFPSQFIDSRQDSNRTRYGPGGIQTLQFNPQQQKFIILDSKQTQVLNPGYMNIIGSFCEDFDVPILDQIPNPDKSPQELVNIAKNAFRKYSKYNINQQTVINVRKYKNCVHFSFDNQNNILYHYQNGKIYYGCWRMLNSGQGQKHGQGVQLLPNKYKFKGVFSEGKKSGYGTLINFDGSAYVGQWDNGLRHGAGKQLDAEGIIYQGQWKQGKKSGYGKIYNNGRLEFQGVFIKGLKNGYGKQYFQNGDYYDGNYLNHKFQGKGTYSWISGAHYTGEFKGGKRNGQGIWRSSDQADCDIYEGDYLQDKKHGKGIYKWANGALYQGSFKDDIKHGAGTIVYQNGKVVHLTFKNGKAEKRIQKQQNGQVQPEHNHQLSQRKRSLNSFQSKNKNNNFILRSRPATRSTQNLNSARSTSTTNSQGFPKGVTFNTRSNPKLSRAINQKPLVKTGEQQIIRLKFDNKQFEKAIGKNWNKNLIITKTNEPEIGLNNRPPYPKDRNYQGIQYSGNINMEL